MCELIKIGSGSYKKNILSFSKKIIKSSSISENRHIVTKYEYPNKGIVIKMILNKIAKTKTRYIAEFNDNKELLRTSVSFFENCSWFKSVESQYSYNLKKDIKYCIRTRFLKNGDIITEKSEDQIIKTDKFLKEISTNKNTNDQSINEYKYDDSGREVEFQMYSIKGGERMNTIKTTNQFENNIEVYSVFSAKSKESSEWSLMFKTTTESLPHKLIHITDDYVNRVKEKRIQYINDSYKTSKIISSEFIDNNWKLTVKTEYEYTNKYLSKEQYFVYENNLWIIKEKTEYENIDGFLTKEVQFNKEGQNWIKICDKLFEYE